MAKPDFSEIVSKVKNGVGDVAEKVKSGRTEKVKESADGLIKTIQDKSAKKPDTAKTEIKPSKKEKLPEKEKKAKETEPKVKLDDALCIAVDQYNDAYTTMNDNGATLYRERIRAVDMITHIEDLVNSIANRPKDFDTDIAEIKTRRETFIGACEFAKQKLEVARKSALGAGAGVATGAAIVGGKEFSLFLTP